MGKRFLTAASLLLLATAGSLQAQTIEERLSALEARMDSIEQRVTRLESFHPQREFTISQGNFTLDEFNAYITALDVKDGDWVYAKSTGDIDGDGREDSMEICTSGPRFISLFGYYLNGNPDDPFGRNYYFNGDPQNDLTYTQMNFTRGISREWGVARGIIAESAKHERLKLRAYGDGGDFIADIWPRSSNIHFFSDGPDHKVTFKAGSTRAEACGF